MARAQHPAPGRSWRPAHPWGHNTSNPHFADHPAVNISSEYQQQPAPLSPSALSQVVPHALHLQTPILEFFSLSLTQPLAPGALCLRAEQFTALSCKITCANANRINFPAHKAEDTWNGAKSQQSSSLADTSG